MNHSLVSIITPCYNSSDFLAETIESVISQTYQNWEMLICDDCSTDSSADIIKFYSQKDIRIKYLKTSSPSGSPTEPRNICIKEARGRFLAFLDSDDLWLPSKLEKQISVFDRYDDTIVVFSNYEKIDEKGSRENRFVEVSCHTVDYNKLLYGNVIGNLTGVYDTLKTPKIYLTNIGHEDYAMWLEILKHGYVARNTMSIEALYRVRNKSVSSNKFIALKWTWNILYNVERLSFIKAVSCFVHYIISAFKKSCI